MRPKRGSEIGHEILSEHTEGLWSRLKVKGMERRRVKSSTMVTVSETGQEFQKSSQREKSENSGLETEPMLREKTLAKGSCYPRIKMP